MEDRLPGRVVFERYPAEQLAKAFNQLDSVRNRVAGFGQALSAYRKYCFVAIKCHRDESAKHLIKLYWIVNANVKEFLKDDWEDYEWTKFDQSNYDEFIERFQEKAYASSMFC